MHSMKSIIRIALLAILPVAFIISCKPKVDPISERVKKVWIARIVKENGSVVYSNGSSSNIKEAYSSYRLNLSNAPTATITEVDGQSYTGTYTVQNDNKIVISGITPEPTGTGGVLEYSILSISDDNVDLVLKLDTAYPKTGNTTNEYTLIAQ